MTTGIPALKKAILVRLPDAIIAVDPPARRGGTTYLDIRHANRAVVVEWRPKLGFGISSAPDCAYGEGPHEVYATAAKAARRLCSLLASGERTQSPREVLLATLRDELGLSQEEVARVLKVRQAAISKLERRSDMRISTLRKFVRALGGDLVIEVQLGKKLRRLRFERD